MIPHISTTQSESGRHTGVIMVSDGLMDYRILNELQGALKRVTGGVSNEPSKYHESAGSKLTKITIR